MFRSVKFEKGNPYLNIEPISVLYVWDRFIADNNIQNNMWGGVELIRDPNINLLPPPYNAGAYTHRHTEPFFT